MTAVPTPRIVEPMTKDCVIILGDTRELHHFGCEAVLRQLSDMVDLSAVGPPICLHGHDWRRYGRICLESPIVLINGEGSLHDDKPAVSDIVMLAERRRADGKTTMLVNASWMRNSTDFASRLESFQFVSLRDSTSRREAGGDATFDAPDLAVREALIHHRRSPIVERSGMLIGDSTKSADAKRLRRFAHGRGLRFLPILYTPATPLDTPKSRKIHRYSQWCKAVPALAAWLPERYGSHARGAKDLGSYLDAILASEGVVTGRFHTVCFCIGLRVPFVAFGSNTRKIEALVADAGLDPKRRCLEIDRLDDVQSVPLFSEEELVALTGYMQQAEARYARLFDAVQSAVRSAFPRVPK